MDNLNAKIIKSANCTGSKNIAENFKALEFDNQKLIPDTVKPCTDCKVKKVKCQGDIPCCTRCKRFNLQCDIENYVFYNYSSVQPLMQMIQTLEQTLKNNNTPVDVATAETEVDATESTSSKNLTSISSSTIKAQVQHSQSHSQRSDSYNENNTGLALSENVSKSEHILPTSSSNVISLDELSNEVGSLTSANNDNTQGKYIGAATGSNFAKAFLKQMHLQKLNDFNHLSATDFSGFDTNSALYSTSCAPLPPYSIAKVAVNIFITTVHPFYPILSLKEFLDVLELMYSSPNSLNYYQKYLVFIVLAIGLERGEKHSDFKNYYNQFKPVEFFNTAMKYFEKLATSRSVQLLEMHLLEMVWFNNTNAFNDDYGDMWYLGRYLMSLAMELNLHLKLNNQNMTETTIEHRRRLFWVTYLLERKNAVKFGRGLSIKRQEIETEYPSVTRDDYLHFTKLKKTYSKIFFTPALLAIELYDIYGLLLETVYISRTRGIKPTLSDEIVLNYKHQIADQVTNLIAKIGREIPNTMAYHHMLKVKSLIVNVMLNRPSPSFPSPDRASIVSCKESCLDAIESFKFLTSENLLWKTDPSFLHDLVNIGLTMIFCCWKTEEDSEILKTFSTSTIEVMNDMIKYYPSFIKFKNLYIIVSTIIIQNLDKAFKSESCKPNDVLFDDIPSPLQHLKQSMIYAQGQGYSHGQGQVPVTLPGSTPGPSNIKLSAGLNYIIQPSQQMEASERSSMTAPLLTSTENSLFRSTPSNSLENSATTASSGYSICPKNSNVRSSSLFEAQSPMGTPVRAAFTQPKFKKQQFVHPMSEYQQQMEYPPLLLQQQQQAQAQAQNYNNQLPLQPQLPEQQYQYQFPQQLQQQQQQQQPQYTMMGAQVGLEGGSSDGVDPSTSGYVDSMTQELFQDVFKNYYQGDDNVREDLDQLFKFQRFNWA